MITSFELDVHFFPVTSTTSFLPGSFGYVPGVVSLTQIFPVFFFNASNPSSSALGWVI